MFTNCGVNNLNLMKKEKVENEQLFDVQWERYEYVSLKRGLKSIRKLMLVKKTSRPCEMFSYFSQIFRSFPYHQFRASQQSEQLRSLLDNLPHTHCITINDYSESYKCFDKTEIQTGYFQKIEVSIHVTLLYHHAVLEIDSIESTVNNPVIIKEELFVISEDDKRDRYFTHYVQKRFQNIYLGSTIIQKLCTNSMMAAPRNIRADIALVFWQLLFQNQDMNR